MEVGLLSEVADYGRVLISIGAVSIVTVLRLFKNKQSDVVDPGQVNRIQCTRSRKWSWFRKINDYASM